MTRWRTLWPPKLPATTSCPPSITRWRTRAPPKLSATTPCPTPATRSGPIRRSRPRPCSPGSLPAPRGSPSCRGCSGCRSGGPRWSPRPRSRCSGSRGVGSSWGWAPATAMRRSGPSGARIPRRELRWLAWRMRSPSCVPRGRSAMSPITAGFTRSMIWTWSPSRPGRSRSGWVRWGPAGWPWPAVSRTAGSRSCASPARRVSRNCSTRSARRRSRPAGPRTPCVLSTASRSASIRGPAAPPASWPAPPPTSSNSCTASPSWASPALT